MSLLRPYLLFFVVFFLKTAITPAQEIQGQYPIDGFENPRSVLFGNPWHREYLQDSLHTYKYVEHTEEWILHRRQINTFNNHGQPAQSIIFTEVGNKWTPNQRIRFIYNEDQVLTAKETDLYPLSINQWIPDTCISYEYNAYGKITSTSVTKCRSKRPLIYTTYEYSDLDALQKEETWIWNTEHEIWRNFNRTVYTYNSVQNPRTSTEQTWHEATQSWENEQMISYNYNVSGESLMQLTHQYWNPEQTQWDNEQIVEFEYNQQGQVIHYNRFPADSEPGSGQPQSDVPLSINYTYTTQGNPVQILVGEYNSGQNSWSYTEKSDYFWSLHSTGKIQDSDRNLCFFTNPYHSGDVLRCPNLKDDVPYTLRILDQQGRTLYQKNIPVTSAFQVETTLPPGLYFFVVSGGLDHFSQKVVFANK